jgi:D-threonine aldolase
MEEHSSPWYIIDNSSEIDTPALAIFPERVHKNIATAKSMVRDVSLLRPHAKTHKSPDAARALLEAGIIKFKCATIAEAEMLAMVKAPDVLLAYQPVGPKILRLLRLVQKFPRTIFSCLVDNETAARQIGAVFASQQLVIPVYIDLNVGMNRTGIGPDDRAARLFHACLSLPGVRPVGLHAYDGHIQGVDVAERAEACRQAFDPVRSLQQTIHELDYVMPVIVAGGSPTFPMHARNAGVECSPGTFIYWDKSYASSLPEQPFVPAAVVLSRVVSQPSKTTLCLDAGYKSVASEKDLHHRLFFLNAPDAVFIGQSEEHLVIDVGEGHAFAIGDLLYGMPFHICPTCALFERAITVHEHFADGEWTMTARNRTITI